MRTSPRPRRYVSPAALVVLRPLFALDVWRDAYLLRGVGDHVGPVLRIDRRRRDGVIRIGPDRRVPATARRRRP